MDEDKAKQIAGGFSSQTGMDPVSSTIMRIKQSLLGHSSNQDGVDPNIQAKEGALKQFLLNQELIPKDE